MVLETDVRATAPTPARLRLRGTFLDVESAEAIAIATTAARRCQSEPGGYRFPPRDCCEEAYVEKLCADAGRLGGREDVSLDTIPYKRNDQSSSLSRGACDNAWHPGKSVELSPAMVSTRKPSLEVEELDGSFEFSPSSSRTKLSPKAPAFCPSQLYLPSPNAAVLPPSYHYGAAQAPYWY
eukprot:TRINITY_DN58495_c0_g1_i1.p1 TRINITY_DN58495_c0_g1~~TRINITY_DN58495_c0_g1_i1.p1  ORF type:complete len:181 (+),score=28.81 TRINITY_DN58495_c0_g1_i1:168-710(+)